MSNSDRPPDGGGRDPALARSGCLTAFLILAGAVLLLPGLCAIIMFAADWKGALSASTLPFLVILLAIGFGGVVMIRAGIRGPRR